MNRIVTLLLVSVVSAIVAVCMYRYMAGPQQILIRQALPVSYVQESYPVADNDRQTYGLLEKAPSLKSDGFVHAAYVGRRAVVAIQASGSSGYWRSESRGSNTGSGVIISPDGYIATNNHVIDDGTQITITLNDRREYKARVVGKDPTTDLALIKIDAEGLPFLVFGNSDSLHVGEWVLAVGNPFRLQSTVTAGIVSARGRNIQILADQTGIESFIQTDAAVNPGNSGGALLNTRGELIGINTAIITYSGQYEGFSFAIPGNLAKKVLFDLREYGAVQRGWMGVTIRAVDDVMARQLKLEKVAGVYLDVVNSNSAADEAGLKAGDVIISVNGVKINSTPEFMEHVGRKRPGDKVEVAFIRKGQERLTQVVLSDQRFAAVAQHIKSGESLLRDLGLEVRDLTASEKNRLRAEGVIVERVRRGSPIARTNMEKEYVITKINERPVTSVEELYAEVARIDGQVLVEGFYEKYPGSYPYTFRKE